MHARKLHNVNFFITYFLLKVNPMSLICVILGTTVVGVQLLPDQSPREESASMGPTVPREALNL